MSAMSQHPDEKKRRGFLGLFGRKTKSSTGDSSVSSGSAGDRSVSPARSDESTDGRPMPQSGLCLGSSANALNKMNYQSSGSIPSFGVSSLSNSMNNIDTTSARLTRPVSMVALSAKKKRAPPIPTQKANVCQSQINTVEKTNVSVEKKCLSRQNSDSSGYHESEDKSNQTSPSSSELSSLEASRSSLPSTSNLTSVSSNSVSSIPSKSKRKAPCPPASIATSESSSTIPENFELPQTNDAEPAPNHISPSSSIGNVSTEHRSDASDGGSSYLSCQDRADILESSSNLKTNSNEEKFPEGETLCRTPQERPQGRLTSTPAKIPKTVPVDKQCSKVSSSTGVDLSSISSKTSASAEKVVVRESASPVLVCSEKSRRMTWCSSNLLHEWKEIASKGTSILHKSTSNVTKPDFWEENARRFISNVRENEFYNTDLNAPKHLSFSPINRLKSPRNKPHFLKPHPPKKPKRPRRATAVLTADSINSFPKLAKRLKEKLHYGSLPHLHLDVDLHPLDIDDGLPITPMNSLDQCREISSPYADDTFDDRISVSSGFSTSTLHSLSSNPNSPETYFPSRIEAAEKKKPVPAPRKKRRRSLSSQEYIKQGDIAGSRDIKKHLIPQIHERSLKSKIYYSSSSESFRSALDDESVLQDFHIKEIVTLPRSLFLDDNTFSPTKDLKNSSEFVSLVNDNPNVIDNSCAIDSINEEELSDSKNENIEVDKDSPSNQFPDDEVQDLSAVEEISQKVHLKENSLSSPDEQFGSNSIRSSINSLSFGSDETETQIKSVSLSSESGSTSSDVINLKDITKPKRHKRKGIPDAFRNDSPKSSSTVHLETHTESVAEEAAFVETGKRNDASRLSADTFGLVSENSEVSLSVPNEAYNVDIFESSRKHLNLAEAAYNESSVDFKESCEKNGKLKSVSIVKLNMDSPNQAEQSSSGILEKSCKEIEGRRSSGHIQENLIREIKFSMDNIDTQPRIVNFTPKEINSISPKRQSYTTILSKNIDTPRKTSKSIVSNHTPTNISSIDCSDFGRKQPLGSSMSIHCTNNAKLSVNGITKHSRNPPGSKNVAVTTLTSKTSSNEKVSPESEDDDDDQVFIPSKVAGFSISTYQSRASKISYDKKLTRSESMSSIKDGNRLPRVAGGRLEDESRKIKRSDSQRNEIFTSKNIKASYCSRGSEDSKGEEMKAILESPTKSKFPFRRSNSKSSLMDMKDGRHWSEDDTISFDVSCAQEPVVFTRPKTKYSLSNLRKAKSSVDISQGEIQIPDDAQCSDDGLNSEYLRLQDDFLKWQQQLMQNQQVLHNRVAPIAANPPSMNNYTGMPNAGRNERPQNIGGDRKKPVEISIPIRYEDTGEIVNQTQSSQNGRFAPEGGIQLRPNVTDMSHNEILDGQSHFRISPNVSMGQWQQRPDDPATRPNHAARSPLQPDSVDFEPPSRFQTVYHSKPDAKTAFSPQPNVIFNNVQTTLDGEQMTQPKQQPAAQQVFRRSPQPDHSRFATQLDTSQTPDRCSPNPESINAKFSSVVTLSDNSDEKAAPKGKVRSVVQLNQSPEVPARSSQPSPNREVHGPAINCHRPEPSLAPVSSRLVQQAVQKTPERRFTPPREQECSVDTEHLIRPSDIRHAPQHLNHDQQNSTKPFAGIAERRVTPPRDQESSVDTEHLMRPSDFRNAPQRTSPDPQSSAKPFAGSHATPFAGIQLPSLDSTTRPSPEEGPGATNSIPSSAPPPPPPPPTIAPPPPPPPQMSRRTPDRRTIPPLASVPPTANESQLDARGELMMAIRDFGGAGAGKLRRSPFPPCQ